ncbi:hypothetical protein ACH3XW_9070 [Acanthocheilonema viteae]
MAEWSKAPDSSNNVLHTSMSVMWVFWYRDRCVGSNPTPCTPFRKNHYFPPVETLFRFTYSFECNLEDEKFQKKVVKNSPVWLGFNT